MTVEVGWRTPFRATIEESLMDGISQELMIKAVSIHPCGHSFNISTIIGLLQTKQEDEGLPCPALDCNSQLPSLDDVVENLTSRFMVNPCNHEFNGETLISSLVAQRILSCPTCREPIASYAPDYRIRELAETMQREIIKKENNEILINFAAVLTEVLDFGDNDLSQILESDASNSEQVSRLSQWFNEQDFSQIEHLDLSRYCPRSNAIASLKGLPLEIGRFTSLKTLNCEGHDITSLPSEISKLTLLEELNLTENEMDTIPQEIKLLINLKGLHLNENKIRILSDEIRLPSCLEILDLSGNNLEYLSPYINYPANLLTCNLSRNKLRALPHQIGLLDHLTTLDLSDNILESLPSELGLLSRLKSLDLSKNKLRSIHPHLGNLRALSELKLEDNELETVPAQVSALPAYNGLGKQNNLSPIVHLAQSLFLQADNIVDRATLASLKKVMKQSLDLPTSLKQWFNSRDFIDILALDLKNLRWNILPSEIKQFQYLDELHLQGNNLKTLPYVIGNLINLTTLDVSDNKLTSLPSKIPLLTNLEVLKISNNRLNKITSKIGKLINLKVLDISSNRLRTLPKSILKLSALQSFEFNNNPLSGDSLELATSIHNHLHSLEVLLGLEENSAHSLDNEASPQEEVPEAFDTLSLNSPTANDESELMQLSDDSLERQIEDPDCEFYSSDES